MARIDNLDDSQLDKILRRLDKLERQNPLGFSSITRGQLRVGGTATLLVDSSGGVVIHGSIDGDGTFTWSGILNADGTITLTGPLTATGETNLNGPTTMNGDTTQQGPFHVKGATDITGTLDVSGVTTLLANLIVGAGGKITVGALTLDPAVSGAGTVGGITASGTLLLSAPTVVLTGGGQINGLLNAAGGVSLTNLPAISGKTPNLYIDPNDLYQLKQII